MAKQVGTFVDDSRLLPRDNSGGPKGPHGIAGSDWGDGGKPVGGEPANGGSGSADGDEFTMRSGGSMGKPEQASRASRKGGY